MMRQVWNAIRRPAASLERLTIAGHERLSAAFPVTELAAAAIGAATLAVSDLLGVAGHDAPGVEVDRKLASLWFGLSIRSIGWSMPAPWDPVAGDYRAADGWIRLHTNAPHHRAAALGLLGAEGERAAVAKAVAAWAAEALETAVVEAGGCAAAMRSLDAWRRHPPGLAIATEPLIAFTAGPVSGGSHWRPQRHRPLQGLKVLDLTRVLAGPVATRFLAGYGADVLRIDPPGWDEPGVVPEVTLGKRCARLDLESDDDRRTFERCLAQADMLIHGYRPGALDGLGYREAARRAIRPDLIDVSLDAYGWSGPWRDRRGFDSLVQMSAGLADAGMAWAGADRPTPLPVQALDHATGYLMAAAAVRGLIGRLTGEGAATAKLSLARTATLLTEAGSEAPGTWLDPSEADLAAAVEPTPWGPARRYKPPAVIAGAPMAWDRPASALGSAEAHWA